jgi:hypothetical protein
MQEQAKPMDTDSNSESLADAGELAEGEAIVILEDTRGDAESEEEDSDRAEAPSGLGEAPAPLASELSEAGAAVRVAGASQPEVGATTTSTVTAA